MASFDCDDGLEGGEADPWQSPVVGGRYRVLSTHARGGLGVVSKARDRDLRRIVALKEIRPQYTESKENRARFLREAKITGRLEHPGIVPIYSVGEYEDGRPYYTMRMIEGQSLRDAIVDFHNEKMGMEPGDRSLRLRSLLQRFATVCDALSYAHSQGVLHRDIKPDNIMLGKHGETLLVDWGLATQIGDKEEFDISSSMPQLSSESVQTEVGRALGTLLYMSPEQAAGQWEDVSELSDVFSIGATMFSLLTGEAPYEKDAEDLIGDVRHGKVRKVREMDPSVSPPLAAICQRAISADPKDRYIDARELSEDIERWLADEPVLAYRAPPGDQISRFIRRYRGSAVIGVLALAAVTLASLVSLAWVSRVRENTERALERSEQLRFAAETHAYAGQIGMTQLAIAGGSIRQGANLLNGTDETFRGWEYEYLSHQLERDEQGLGMQETIKIANQDGVISDAVLVENGERIVTASFDSKIRSWSRDSGAKLHTFDGHTLKVVDLDASADGSRIASASDDRSVRVWDVNGKQVGICEGHGDRVRAVCFFANGTKLVSSSSNGEIFIWDTTSNELLTRIEAKVNDVLSLDVHPDGTLIAASGEHDSIDLFDAKSGVHLRSLSIDAASKNAVRCVRFSPDGKVLVSGGDEKRLEMWDVESGELLASLGGHSRAITSVSMSPDQERIASGSRDGTVRLCDPITSQTVMTFSDPEHGIEEVSFSDDGKSLLWVSEGKTVSTLSVE